MDLTFQENWMNLAFEDGDETVDLLRLFEKTYRDDLKIIVREGTPTVARALRSGSRLSIRAGRSRTTVRLPRLDVAETVVLEMAP